MIPRNMFSAHDPTDECRFSDKPMLEEENKSDA
jgi:hypothetical protein